MSINSKAANNDRDWTTQKFVSLSKNLEQAYGGVADKTEANSTDFWTTDKFITMSRHLSSAYGVDM